tara:strand:+ start:793 stop:2016 length:1224 start_codon:yes stop_codon:yes gene_type:complete
MGILRKLFKGVKKVFSKIGKGIKKVVKKVGKFADKLGIVGQLGLMFVLPHIGAGLMSGLTKLGSTLAGSSSLIAKGAGAILNTGLKFATTVGNVYRTVTGAVTDFIGTAGKYIGGKLKLPGFEKMSLEKAWSTYSNDVMKNVSSIIDPWKQAVTINPAFGSTVADQAKAVGMSPEQFVQNYTMPENVAASLEGLSGKELANFRFDSVRERIFKPGQASTVKASVLTPITEPFQAVRNTDFWGFAPEVVPPTGSWITDPENAGRLIQTGQAEGVTKAITPAPGTVEPSGVVGSSVVSPETQASLLAPQPEKGWVRQSLEAVPGQTATAVATNVILSEIQGDSPEIPKNEVLSGGFDYFSPSDVRVAQEIRSQPLYQTPVVSVMGSNIVRNGSVSGSSVYEEVLRRGLG